METAKVPSLSAQDERVLAALSHVSVLLPMIGILAPILIWVTQREKSRYTAFQSLQAIVFQLVLILIYFAGFACYLGSFFLVFLSTGILGGFRVSGAAGLLFLFPFGVILLMLVVMFLMAIYGLVGAVMTFQGKDFRYALIGQWVERYTQQAQSNQP